ncbi:von Willebrand factor type A domain-containing protein [Pedobacter sp. N36a]|uniref:YfbK domain-containing protein n=1 Tax=Pedobacter sp. N36a TaxID=2767996 RepID=UPI001656EA67|nr:von Willebrand factor type A domain-containing protein [Pedobacter sp. N36a]MBC8985491.1 von Willebrand factor type A domain-containing protein [Pedobacter sp. N36a]
MRNLFFPLFLVLVLLGFNASAIKKIQGKVIGNGAGIANATVSNLSGSRSAATNRAGEYTIIVEDGDQELRFQAPGYYSQRLSIGTKSILNVKLTIDPPAAKKLAAEEIARNKAKLIRIQGNAIKDPGRRTLEGDPSADIAAYRITTTGSPGVMASEAGTILSKPAVSRMQIRSIERNEFRSKSNTESYKPIQENGFIAPNKTPLSTFSIDVDAAAYSNVRRYLNNGALPPKDAVRTEEMINYFNYDYPQPEGNDPVNIGTEIAATPWNPQHKLVKISLQAKRINTAALPAANLVFLIDVSGSMAQSNKLPLLISSFKLLTDQLRPNDRVAIVVYAGRTELVLPSTPGSAKTTIKDALNKLMASGSTAGGQGLQMAYKVAAENFIKKGNNRIILATDGDFNVGASSDQEMESLIEEKRKSGIFLTVLGYGMGNIKDSKMEILADKGNGNYAYIDNISEARKVLINEFGGTLFTVAKDVKLQVEFNPSKVQAYRLIGYENRLLADEDFNNDLKDAGDMGAGHTVTAFYEVIPFGVKSGFTPFIDPLKYQKFEPMSSNNGSPEILTVKLRYKQPDGHQSKLLQKAVLNTNSPFENASESFRFAAAVAEFGLLLRQSEYKRDANYEQVIRMAQAAKGKDTEGYRAEFINLVKSAALLAKDLLSIENTNKFNEKN